MPTLIHYALLGEFLPGEYSYLAHSATRTERDSVQGWQYLNQAPMFAVYPFLLPELQQHWQGVAITQSSVNPLPAPQPVLRDSTSHFRGHFSGTTLYINGRREGCFSGVIEGKELASRKAKYLVLTTCQPRHWRIKKQEKGMCGWLFWERGFVKKDKVTGETWDKNVARKDKILQW